MLLLDSLGCGLLGYWGQEGETWVLCAAAERIFSAAASFQYVFAECDMLALVLGSFLRVMLMCNDRVYLIAHCIFIFLI